MDKNLLGMLILVSVFVIVVGVALWQQIRRHRHDEYRSLLAWYIPMRKRREGPSESRSCFLWLAHVDERFVAAVDCAAIRDRRHGDPFPQHDRAFPLQSNVRGIRERMERLWKPELDRHGDREILVGVQKVSLSKFLQLLDAFIRLYGHEEYLWQRPVEREDQPSFV